MSKYTPTIGLEIHAELKTRTKMFCDSLNDPDETRPNVNICPVCLAHPGTLPVINKEAVKHVLKMGVAVGGELADYTEFDRKNYFYPDIPKGYQISQYKYPLVSGGELGGVTITRIHLEEDTARSTHEGDHSLVDFNRAGLPLMELVTEPVIHDAETAGRFARELQLLLRYLGAGDANMEKGEMRVEANISVSKSDTLGTKVEVKNLNSFKTVASAIAFEIDRQTKALEQGEKVVQETRGWDDIKQQTFSQRAKEESHDYRYFPEPDLPKLSLSEIPEFEKEVLRAELPELPQARRARYQKLGLTEDVIQTFVGNRALATFFDEVLALLDTNTKAVTLAANYLSSDVLGVIKNDTTLFETRTTLTPQSLCSLISLIQDGSISSRGAKDILAILINDGGDPKQIAEEKNLFQESDETALKALAQKIVDEHPEVVEEYRGGKESALQFFVGQGMKATKGSANPQMLQRLFRDLLS